jgi:phosphatidylglycerol---prolipoprotein diacylglyceryl transferase
VKPTVSILRWRVPTYAVMLYLGCVAGVLFGSMVGASWGMPADRVAAAAIALIAIAFVGSRIHYIATHFDVFRAEPSRLWQRLDGGGAVYGGLLFAIVASPVVLAIVRLDFLRFWDVASLIMLVGLAVTKIGCLMRGCCAGRPTSRLLGVRLPDSKGTYQRRYPSQPLESLCAVLILALTWVAHAVWPSAGVVFGSTIALYGACRICLEQTRLSDGTRWSRPVNQWLSAGLVAAGTALLVVLE